MTKWSKKLWLLSAVAAAAFCQTAAQPVLALRLETDLTSYGSVPGSGFRSVVIAPFEVGGRVLLPPGTLVHGTVRRAIGIGIGLAHERAALELDFREYELPDGQRFPLSARLRSIDNAREAVTKKGQIRGILAASSPQTFWHGLWYRPNPKLFERSLIGLTGASGQMWTRFSMGPAGAVGLIALDFALFRMPEPEIHFPPGTEMNAVVTNIPENAPWFSLPEVSEVPEPLATAITELPFGVTKPNGQPRNDIINLVFIGTRQQLVHAFAAAGWSASDPLTPRSFSRSYKAYTSQVGYAAAPVSKLLYQRAEPDFVFQKSFNTIAKRHHVRIWRSEIAEQEVWLAAASHDVAIRFNPSAMTFTHKIDRMVDGERTKIINDLVFAGCSDSAGYVDRPAAVHVDTTEQVLVTDGRLAVVGLRDCPERTLQVSSVPLPGSSLTRVARRMLLESRQYLLRGNAYYWAYRAIRWRPADSSKGTVND
jgi:hypothetical protein